MSISLLTGGVSDRRGAAPASRLPGPGRRTADRSASLPGTHALLSTFPSKLCVSPHDVDKKQFQCYCKTNPTVTLKLTDKVDKRTVLRLLSPVLKGS